MGKYKAHDSIFGLRLGAYFMLIGLNKTDQVPSSNYLYHTVQAMMGF